jgi:hypothetical protein
MLTQNSNLYVTLKIWNTVHVKYIFQGGLRNVTSFITKNIEIDFLY